MSHKLSIDTKTGKAEMFYVDEEPWHKLGERLSGPPTSAEAIKQAHLDWEVAKVPLAMPYGKTHRELQGHYAVVRLDRWNRDELLTPGGSVLGVVKEYYQPLQNSEAFEFFDPLIKAGSVTYETAGALGDGERVWVLAHLPEDMSVVKDDIVRRYLLLSNSHDGNSSVQVKLTPIRVVCNNTLTMALRDGPALYIAHRQGLRDQLESARELIAAVTRRYDGIADSFRRFAEIGLDERRLGRYLSTVFPDPKRGVTPKDRYRQLKQKVLENRLWSKRFFEAGKGTDIPGVSGTLWAAYNGVAEFVDHRDSGRPESQRLDSIWFGDGYCAKARAFRVAEQLAKSWRN